MDRSQVETLELTNVDLGTFMEHISGELPHLKRLRLSDDDRLTLAHKITSFLHTLPALESLSLHSMIDKIDLSFAAHSPSLQHLELYR